MFPETIEPIGWAFFDDTMERAAEEEIQELKSLANELQQEGFLDLAELVRSTHAKVKTFWEAKGQEATDEIIVELVTLRQVLMKHERFIDKPKKV
jgi:hypothetical protein